MQKPSMILINLSNNYCSMPNYGPVNIQPGFPPQNMGQMPPTNIHQQNSNPMVPHYPQPPNNTHM